MLKMFRRKKVKEKETPNTDKAVSILAKAINAVQTRVANWLSRQEQQMTQKQKKLALLVFCICMSTIAGSFLYKGLFAHADHPPSWLRQQSITLPKTHPVLDSLDPHLLEELIDRHNQIQKETDSTHH